MKDTVPVSEKEIAETMENTTENSLACKHEVPTQQEQEN